MAPMDVKKLISINTILVIILIVVFWLVIHLSAVKDTTWIDTFAIPAGLAIGLVLILNLTILLINRYKK